MDKRLSWDVGASFDDAARDLTLPELIGGLKDRNEPALWDAFFAHMDSTLGPDTNLDKARKDLGDEDAAEMDRKARVDQLRERIRTRLKTLKGRY
jgi:hypothetical protein